MAKPTAYKAGARQYVGNKTYYDAASRQKDPGSEAYRQDVLSARDQNFTAVEGQGGAEDEWRMLQDKATGRRYWRHYDKATGAYDTDLQEDPDENTRSKLNERGFARVGPESGKKQAKQYVGEGKSVDAESAGYNKDSEEYRRFVLQQRDKNFTAVEGGQQDEEWRLLEEKATGKRYWRHYDAANNQYDADLYEAAEENDAAAVAKRDPKQYTPGTYDEGEQVEAKANPYAPGTTAYADFAQKEYERILAVRDKHFTPRNGPADNAEAQQEWRDLRNNDTGYYQRRRFDIASNQYQLEMGQAFNDQGVVGGAGNRVAGKAANNKWDVARSGADARTDEQKYYDRDFKSFQQTADSEGHYSWYGQADEGQSANLDTIDDPTKPKIANRTKYWDYNGAPDEAWFQDQVRKRANASIYARTV